MPFVKVMFLQNNLSNSPARCSNNALENSMPIGLWFSSETKGLNQFVFTELTWNGDQTSWSSTLVDKRNTQSIYTVCRTRVLRSQLPVDVCHFGMIVYCTDTNGVAFGLRGD
ncbi:hypothetical protein NPIL_329031 [Nephila pilipes]|uniref:Uncharacterized protein n=1 Tax=Nephila pilipes TaxID=299642 RepID=A0A8X6QFT2_NEPPI|nr:hypothetical protein NPIL_329031 [Nephila pilipes]